MSCNGASRNQIAAVLSWHAIVPKPKIFVFSTCLPHSLINKATLIASYDATHDGMPLFGSMLHLSQIIATKNNIDTIAWANADIVLHSDFNTGITRLHASLKASGAWMGVVRRFNTRTLMSQQAARRASEHKLGGYDLFIWNAPLIPIVRLPYPPFTRTANKWDNWLVTEAAILRVVCDASHIITAQHVAHASRETPLNDEKNKKTWQNIEYGGWHNMHNRVVEHVFRRGHSDKLGTPDAVKLYITQGGTVQLTNRIVVVKTLLPNKQPFFSFVNKADEHRIALYKTFSNKIMFSGGTGKFSEFIFSFACNFRRVHPGQRLVIIAFDQDMFVKAYMQGYETFQVRNKMPELSEAQSYGSTAYKAITKMKTLASLDVLLNSEIKSYVWADPDVALFKDVLGHLSNMPHDFIVQKNTPLHRKETKLKTNSGVYKLNNVNWVRQSLAEIIHDGNHHGDSEQMSWDRVLCSTQSLTTNKCVWNTHYIHFLDRQEYATGHEDDKATKALRIKRVMPMLRVWHNNWIKPYAAKRLRAVEMHLMYYNKTTGICAN